MTAAALDRVRGRRNSGAVGVAHLQADRVYAFAQISKKHVDDFGDKLLAKFIACGDLGNRAYVDRGNARDFSAHSFSSGTWSGSLDPTRRGTHASLPDRSKLCAVARPRPVTRDRRRQRLAVTGSRSPYELLGILNVEARDDAQASTTVRISAQCHLFVAPGPGDAHFARATARGSISAISRLGIALRNSIETPDTGWQNFSSHEWSASRRAGSLLAPYLRSPTIG